MIERPLPDNQYPDRLIDGAPISTAFRAIQDRLKVAFAAVPDMSHEVITPRPTQSDWDMMTKRMPAVGLGWQSFNPPGPVGASYEGELVFPVFLMTRQSRRDWQYFGDGKVPGLLGLTSIAVRMLHGWTIDDIGTCMVRQVGTTSEATWIAQDIAFGVLAVTIPNVRFDDESLADQLSDWLRMGETFVTDGAVAPDVVLDVRNP